jgi:lipopolysaccharide transport system ATP-binding protein
MSDIAIRVENLSKLYSIGTGKKRYDTLRDEIADTVRVLLTRNGRRPSVSGPDNTIWALKDVSFEIQQGEVVGIIGRNGAGKSTLLKILSRITEPTKGQAEIYGRIGSLLEVGTGFHSELSGRENIYLNGAILGMKKAEIHRKFDEIVAFADVEKFIDTPVKRYSSGMYVRLAFAVAAHLEPEILVVDEVLAVGDARFQRKCLNKMQEVGQQGRTVLFVSHNMPAVTRLCPRAILLDEGRVLEDGRSSQAVGAYFTSGLGITAAREWPDPTKAPGREIARLCAVTVRNEDGRIRDSIDIAQAVTIEMEYEVLRPSYVLLPNLQFYNHDGIHIFGAYEVDAKWRRQPRSPGRYISRVVIPGNFLNDGTIYVGAGLEAINPPRFQFYERDAVAFHVTEGSGSNSARGDYTGRIGGVIRPVFKWSTELLTPA